MATKKTKNLDKDNLVLAIKKERKVLESLRMNHALEPLKNTMRIREQRRSIARMLTILNQGKSA